jgi:ribokinase
MSVVVAGSLNMDLVLRVRHLPAAGETVHGHGFAMCGGGKGANQAIAAARLGAGVAMIGCVGADDFGRTLHASLVDDGVAVDFVSQCPGVATGVATILVDDQGQNCIALAPGANARLSPAHIDAAGALIAQAGLLILQLEVPLQTTLHAIATAAASHVAVLLNPAPALHLPDFAWHLVDYLVPNETEATSLSGVVVRDPASAAQAADILRARGVPNVLITLGAQGVFIASESRRLHLPARRVEVADTTAAGDAFIGGLAAGLDEGRTLEDAARLGMSAAGLCVTRHGAQPALPRRHELKEVETI